MKEGIHPTYYEDAVIVCGTCGTVWRTGSTKKEIHTDVCSNCHPFYTGTQRIVDTAGQVERFMKRQAAREQRAVQPAPAPAPAEEKQPTKKEKRERRRGDMRSGARRREIEQERTTAEIQLPKATAIEPTEGGFVVESVPVEEVPATEAEAQSIAAQGIQESVEIDEAVRDAMVADTEPVIEASAPVSEGAAETQARTPEMTEQPVMTEAGALPTAEAAAQPEAFELTEVPMTQNEGSVVPETVGAQAAAEVTEAIAASTPDVEVPGNAEAMAQPTTRSRTHSRRGTAESREGAPARERKPRAKRGMVESGEPSAANSDEIGGTIPYRETPTAEPAETTPTASAESSTLAEESGMDFPEGEDAQ